MTKLVDVAGTTYAKEKRNIYALVQRAVGRMTEVQITLAEARQIFDLVMEEAVASAARCGSFRLPNGLGALKTKTIPGGEKKLPTGQTVDFEARTRLTYEGGLLTKALIEAGGEFVNLRDPKKPPTRWVLALEVMGTIGSLTGEEEEEDFFDEISLDG